MAIYIVDNGEAYSAHALFFVEAPDWFPEWLMSYLEWYKGRHPRVRAEDLPHIIGKADAIEWREARNMTAEEAREALVNCAGHYDDDGGAPPLPDPPET